MKKWKKRCSRRRRSMARNRAQLFDRWVEARAQKMLRCLFTQKQLDEWADAYVRCLIEGRP